MMDREERKKKLLERSAKRLQVIAGQNSFEPLIPNASELSEPKSLLANRTECTVTNPSSPILDEILNDDQTSIITEQISSFAEQLPKPKSQHQSPVSSITSSSLQKHLHILFLSLIIACNLFNIKIYIGMLTIFFVIVSNKLLLNRFRFEIWDVADLNRYLCLYLVIWVLKKALIYDWIFQQYLPFV